MMAMIITIIKQHLQHHPQFSQPPSYSRCRNGDGSNSGSKDSRRDTSRAVGMSFFIFLILFFSVMLMIILGQSTLQKKIVG